MSRLLAWLPELNPDRLTGIKVRLSSQRLISEWPSAKANPQAPLW